MERYLTEEEIAEQLQVSRTLLWALRKEGFPHYRLGRVVRYQADDVHEWLKNHHNSNAAPAEAPKGDKI